MSENHEIVILGANFAGTGVAHYLLKHTIPALTALDSSKSYHISLVGPADQFYFKIAVPRTVADPSKIPLSKLTVSIVDAFEIYPKGSFTFVQGLATGLEADAKTVTVTARDGATKALSYNTLIIATGTKSDSLWTVNDDLTSTKASLDALHQVLPSAKTVVIAGGGPVGVETAGEIVAKFPNIKVTLFSGGKRLLPNLSAKTSGKAENMLKSKGVAVVHNKRIKSPTSTTAPGGGVVVELEDGSKQEADVYIHSIGGLPNTGFLPASWLDERKKVKVDFETNRTDVPGVYALGDAAGNSDSTVIDFYSQWPAVVSAIGCDIAESIGRKDPSGAAFKVKKFKKMKDTQLVPIGPGGGVGQVFGWGVPSFLVWLVKSRTFFIEKARPSGLGEDYKKA